MIAGEPAMKAAVQFMLIELPQPLPPPLKMILTKLLTSKVMGIILYKENNWNFQRPLLMTPQASKLQEKIKEQMNTKRGNLVFHIDFIQR